MTLEGGGAANKLPHTLLTGISGYLYEDYKADQSISSKRIPYRIQRPVNLKIIQIDPQSFRINSKTILSIPE